MIMKLGRNIQWVEIFSNLKNPGEVISNSEVLRHNSHFDVSRLLKSGKSSLHLCFWMD